MCRYKLRQGEEALQKQAKDQRILYGRSRASATIDPAVNVKSSGMQRVRTS